MLNQEGVAEGAVCAFNDLGAVAEGVSPSVRSRRRRAAPAMDRCISAGGADTRLETCASRIALALDSSVQGADPADKIMGIPPGKRGRNPQVDNEPLLDRPSSSQRAANCL